jgi:hypothetical protein
MGRTEPEYNAEDHFARGTMLKSFLSIFHWGRTTLESCPWNMDRMPDVKTGCDGLHIVFLDNMFKDSRFPWKDIAAISGAHTLGRMHP